MSEKRDLLFELGTEELPPKALKRLCESLCEGVREGLRKSDLAFADLHGYATPRRLAVLVKGLDAAQPDKVVERRGPAVTAAFDGEGVPTKAAVGFARSCGVEVDQLETAENDKGAWLVFRSAQTGRPAAELIPGIVTESLDRLPIPKRMRWGSGTAEFVRPVHWVVLLFGDEVIDTEILACRTGRVTRGHRFHHAQPIYIGEPEAYAPLLESEGRVMVDFVTRREAIRAQVLEAAARLNGKALLDDDLLDEVTGLVEWPVAVVGSFDQRFLDVPSEALVSAMKGHQKYFPVVDGSLRLLPHFIAIANVESRDPIKVQKGNERVIRPRLTDAEFFWTQDRKVSLAERLDLLGKVVFQNKLGTLLDKTNRVKALAERVAKVIGTDAQAAGRAALLSKTDLMTSMVGEFPELQGIMGRYYARLDGEEPEVAVALDDQYRPRFAGDNLPSTGTGQALALADRLDSLVGIFGIGQTPSGDKDPFGLRRAALGVIRIGIEKRLEFDLTALLGAAAEAFAATGVKLVDDTVEQVFQFVTERMRNYFLDRGVAYDTVEAVLALRPASPHDTELRVGAVTCFRKLPEADSLAAANKRILNILRKTEDFTETEIDASRLVEKAEKDLYQAVLGQERDVAPLLANRAYEEALKRLAGLRGVIDQFFEHVMVMAEDPVLRNNRLSLLSRVQGLFLRVADLSRLQG